MDIVSASDVRAKGCDEVVSLLSWAVLQYKTDFCSQRLLICFLAPKALHRLSNLSTAWDQATMLHFMFWPAPRLHAPQMVQRLCYDVLHKVEALTMNTYPLH